MVVEPSAPVGAYAVVELGALVAPGADVQRAALVGPRAVVELGALVESAQRPTDTGRRR